MNKEEWVLNLEGLINEYIEILTMYQTLSHRQPDNEYFNERVKTTLKFLDDLKDFKKCLLEIDLKV